MGKFFKAALLLLMLPFIANGQKNSGASADSIVNKFTETLRGQGFEKIGSAKYFCPGYYKIWKQGDRCDFTTEYTQIYVFWEDSSVSFVKKFDNCGSFSAVQMSSSPFFEYFEDYSEPILGETVSTFEFIKYVNGKEEVDPLTTDHSCRREFRIIKDGEYLSKSINLFDLKKADAEKKNIHYSANSKLRMVAWDERISKFVWKIEDRGGFVRELVEEEISESASE